MDVLAFFIHVRPFFMDAGRAGPGGPGLEGDGGTKREGHNLHVRRMDLLQEMFTNEYA